MISRLWSTRAASLIMSDLVMAFAMIEMVEYCAKDLILPVCLLSPIVMVQ